MRSLPIPLLSLSLALSASGSDGVLEISQTCAVHTGCFAGDDPGFPVTISQPGSYVLTSGLGSGSSAASVIEILATDVTLDLGSFAVGGNEDGLPAILATADRVSIRNGHVIDVDVGIYLENASSIEGVKVEGFFDGPQGIRVGAMGLILNCILDENSGGRTAIIAGPGSLVLNNRTWSGDSITASGSVVQGNQTGSNDSYLDATDKSLAIGNRLGGDVLRLSADSSFRSNRVYQNGSVDDPILGGIDAGGNLCESDLFYPNPPLLWIPCP